MQSMGASRAPTVRCPPSCQTSRRTDRTDSIADQQVVIARHPCRRLGVRCLVGQQGWLRKPGRLGRPGRRVQALRRSSGGTGEIAPLLPILRGERTAHGRRMDARWRGSGADRRHGEGRDPSRPCADARRARAPRNATIAASRSRRSGARRFRASAPASPASRSATRRSSTRPSIGAAARIASCARRV